jgi:hypothetical protein
MTSRWPPGGAAPPVDLWTTLRVALEPHEALPQQRSTRVLPTPVNSHAPYLCVARTPRPCSGAVFRVRFVVGEKRGERRGNRRKVGVSRLGPRGLRDDGSSGRRCAAVCGGRDDCRAWRRGGGGPQGDGARARVWRSSRCSGASSRVGCGARSGGRAGALQAPRARRPWPRPEAPEGCAARAKARSSRRRGSAPRSAWRRRSWHRGSQRARGRRRERGFRRAARPLGAAAGSERHGPPHHRNRAP